MLTAVPFGFVQGALAAGADASSAALVVISDQPVKRAAQTSKCCLYNLLQSTTLAVHSAAHG